MNKAEIQKYIDQSVDRRIAQELQSAIDNRIQMHELSIRVLKLRELNFEDWGECDRPRALSEDRYKHLNIRYAGVDILLPYLDSLIEKLENGN